CNMGADVSFSQGPRRLCEASMAATLEGSGEPPTRRCEDFLCESAINLLRGVTPPLGPPAMPSLFCATCTTPAPVSAARLFCRGRNARGRNARARAFCDRPGLCVLGLGSLCAGEDKLCHH
ncbi:MAG: hypothetical protein ACPIOQ_40890, partial [Promethearchaeia archaeon]